MLILLHLQLIISLQILNEKHVNHTFNIYLLSPMYSYYKNIREFDGNYNFFL